MKKQKGFTLIELLIALAILIITAAGGVVVWEKKVKPTPTPGPATPSAVSPINVPEEIISISRQTAEWKTHTNTFFGYSLKYPGDWQLTDRPIPQHENWTYLISVVVTKASSCVGEKPVVGRPWCGASFTLDVGKNPEGQTLVAWMKRHVGDLPANLSNITVNGIKGVRFLGTSPGHPYLETEDKVGVVGFARNKVVYILKYRVSGPDPGGSLFNKLELILSTFKFLPVSYEIEEPTQIEGQCSRESGYDTCPTGYLCYWSWECPKGPQNLCGPPTGDFLCHKKCQTDSDCPSNMPLCKEIALMRGDTGNYYRMCMK